MGQVDVEIVVATLDESATISQCPHFFRKVRRDPILVREQQPIA